MSIGEILVILLVAMLITKPKDLPVIINKIKKIFLFFRKSKTEIFSYIENQLELKDNSSEDQSEKIETINFYLEKIIQIQGKYEGNYDLDSVKSKYFTLNKNKFYNRDNN